MEKALEIAACLGMGDKFKASNGCLSRWKQHYNVSHRTVGGELGDVSTETFESWLECLPPILTAYEAQNIWNSDKGKRCLIKVWQKKERLVKGANNLSYDVPSSFFCECKSRE